MLSVDDSMRGYARFGKKIGTDNVTLSSDVSMELAEQVTVGMTVVYTKTKVNGTTSGSLFKFPDTALICLNNPTQLVDNDGTTVWAWEVDEGTPVQGTYDVDSVVSVYGHPALFLKGDSGNIQIRTTTKIVPGDNLIPVHDTDAGLIEGKYVQIEAVGDCVTIPGATPVNSYSVSIPRRYVHLFDDTLCYIKADVAYVSPLIPATEINGVFFLDFVSGTTLGDDTEDVSISLNIHRSDYSIARSYTAVGKNTAVVLGATPAADLATGNVDRGRLVPMYDGSLYSVNNEEGLCAFGYDFVTAIDTKLRLSVKGQAGTEIRVTTSNGTTLYTLSVTPTVIDLSDIETPFVVFRVTGAANSSLIWKSLSTDEDCSFITYSVVARIKQEEVWSGSGLVLKPVMSPLKDSYAIVDGTTFIINGGAFL
jgi:hypothetical protein